MNTQSARIGHVHQTPYPLPGRENMPVDRGPVAKEPLTINFEQERKDGFTGHNLITWEDGQITGILRSPRKPIFVDTARLARSIAQAEHRIKNDYTPKLEKLKAGNLYSETEKMQKIIDQSKANVSAWRREIETAEDAEKDYQAALASLNKAIRDAIK